MTNPGNSRSSSLYRFLLSFKYAFNGILILLATQRNARIHMVAAIVGIAGGFYSSISRTEWLTIVLSIGIVLAAEAFNTTIEEIIDKFSPEFTGQPKG